jgi:hypothetical protein
MLHYPFVEIWNNFWDTTPNITVYLKHGKVVPILEIWYPVNLMNMEVHIL